MAGLEDDPSAQSPQKNCRWLKRRAMRRLMDIVGIHESDDLNKMLPNETMFLAYPELEVIFYKHLADKRLLSDAHKVNLVRYEVKASKTRQQIGGH